MVTKTPEELALMGPEEKRAYLEGEAVATFGVGYRKDKQGRPIEHGIGAPGNETEQHYVALAKREGQAVADAARAKAAARAR